VKHGGAALLCGALEQHARCAALLAGCSAAAAAAAARHEDAKVALFKAGASSALLAALQAHPEDARLAAAACAALAALATPDDPRISASSAFAHGRQLHRAGAHATVLAALRRHAGSTRARAAACAALRAVAVNDEACVQIAELGAVEALVALLPAGAPGGEAAQARSALHTLRQLAGADAVKARFQAAGGLPPLARLLACPPTAEAALALLAALSLRTPELVAAAAAAGALEAALEAMAAQPAAAGLQRAACMCLRNAAARNVELRPQLLAAGAEVLLRAAKEAHPALCADVGSAALRDLGAERYNEGWTPTTVYMGAEGQLFSYEELGGEEEDEAALAAVPEEEE